MDSGIRFIEGKFLEDTIFTARLFLKTNRFYKVNYDVHRWVKVENSIQTSTDSSHLTKFIHDLVYAVEKFDEMIKSLDRSHVNYHKVVRIFKAKQQSFVFSLFIKAFRCHNLSFKDLKKLLARLKNLGIYPLDPKRGGIGSDKTRFMYSLTFVPIFNNKTLLFLGLRFTRLVSSQ